MLADQQRPQLARRRLGRTELMVTELGLGAMDTPQSPEGDATLRAAIYLGINFVDTAREYAGSEFLIGQLVRDAGAAGLHIGTKTFSHTIDGSQRDVDRSLSMLGVERIDLYQLHDISTPEAWAQVMGENGALEGLQIARYRGLIDHIGISSHSLEILELAIASGEFGAVKSAVSLVRTALCVFVRSMLTAMKPSSPTMSMPELFRNSRRVVMPSPSPRA